MLKSKIEEARKRATHSGADDEDVLEAKGSNSGSDGGVKVRVVVGVGGDDRNGRRLLWEHPVQDKKDIVHYVSRNEVSEPAPRVVLRVLSGEGSLVKELGERRKAMTHPTQRSG
jgi:hypothetical protein